MHLPLFFRFLIHEDLTKFDLSSLKYCTIAGEALNPAVFDTFKKLTGIKLMEGFGQTETYSYHCHYALDATETG